jgi:UDP:flavonoid glycosyltransferase YjiC (YdhE family)
LFENINIRRVLIAPLDWGLGHATRCIPIIHALLVNGYEVVIAADGVPSVLLAKEFPTIKSLTLKGYEIKYAKTGAGLFWQLLKQLPRIVQTISTENAWLQKIIVSEKIDLVISDNRFGLHTKLVPCIFITHQLTIKAPIVWVEKILQKVNYYFINQYSVCWVPDIAGDINLAGELSHPTVMPKIPVKYIGLLSRLENNHFAIEFQYCFLLSGPEPQRTVLEKKLVASIGALPGKALLVRGLPGSNKELIAPLNTIVYNHLPTHQLSKMICASEMIICRSGYSTIMELVRLQKKAVLIPTPGQTEQAYLAKKLAALNWFYSADQTSLNVSTQIKEALYQSYSIPDFHFFHSNDLPALLRKG